MVHGSLFSSVELMARRMRSYTESVLLARFLDGTVDEKILLKMCTADDAFWSPSAYFLVSALIAMAED